MSDAPVGGQDPETEGRPPSPEAASPVGPADGPEPAGASGESEAATEATAKAAKAKFDVFAAKGTPLPFSEAPDLEAELEAEAQEEQAASPDAATTVLPDISAAREAAEARDEDGDDEADDEDSGEALTELVEQSFGRAESSPADDETETDEVAGADDEDGPIEPAPPATEVEETTLIPKVTDVRPTESTTVMPPVSVPTPGMQHRPYTSAPSGYGARSASASWGTAQTAVPQGPTVTPAGGLPDAQPTQVQPAVSGQDAQPTRIQPAVLAPAANPNGRGYRPPEFHQVDSSRAELPAPQNFRLDRRELDAAADAEGGRKFGRRAMLIGGGAAIVAAAGLTVSGVVKLPGTSAPTVPTVGYSPAAESGASDATQTGTAFLQAWQNGELEAAANITDNPTEALAAFKWYKENLGVVGLTINPNAANGVGWMTFSISTQAGSPMGEWQYQSGFAAYSKQIGSYTRWFVQWSPQIIYTSLKTGYQLKIVKTPASVKGLIDRNGAAIVASEHPSLAGTISKLISTAKVTGATDGQKIIMVDEKGNQLATVTTLTDPIDSGTVLTTLDMNVQAAAEAAVLFHTDSSIVAIEPSSGHILAIANNTTSDYYDNALLAGVAPGSTFKIITSTALLDAGMVTLDENAPCPAVLDVESTLLHNSEDEQGLDNTYEVDFAQSCNNAFSTFWNHQGMTENLLADTASKYYGLNQHWDIGLGDATQYMNIPTGLSGAGLAESLVGQDNITSCPLAMCSVAATVANGSFMQPILLPKYKQITATALPSSLHAELKTLMSSVISEGTAAGKFPNNGHYFGKTGTAEVGAGTSQYNNSWFVVFNDSHDLCLCALSIRGSFGATTAAPECAQVFKKLFPADF
jgi:beta-lactamase class D